MPSQLLTRVQRLINPSVARDVNRFAGTSGDADAPPHPAGFATDQTTTPSHNTHPHWAGGTGGVIATPSSITIHGTSGWISFASAQHSASQLKSQGEWQWVASLGKWYDSRGVASQFTIDSNGVIFPTIGAEDADGDIRMVYHNEAMNSCSIGIEQTDFGDAGACRPPATSNVFLYRLNERTGTTAATEDLAGRKVYAQLHPSGTEDIVLVWIAMDSYTGPGDIITSRTPHEVPNHTHFTGWNNSFFTERDYRSLAALSRYLAERHKIPRNFPTLPYVSRELDRGDASVFRQLLLGDPIGDRIATRIGLDANVARTNGAAWTNSYLHDTHSITPFAFWNNFFGLPTGAGGNAVKPSYRGFLSHWLNGGHRCPGPLFDWHRFAHEVWDWWWYPFDFAAGNSSPLQASTVSRPYRQARADTRLVEYYYDAVGGALEYTAQRLTNTPALMGTYEQFSLGLQVPLYALANGVIVAACLPIENTVGGSKGFILTRHEVFLPEATGEIRYDTPPTRVWSLIRYIDPAGFQTNQISLTNPEWLNRLVMRLTECELAVQYHTNHGTGTTAVAQRLTRAWGHQPIPPAAGAPPSSMPTSGELIERDATAYRDLADSLAAGKATLFPRDIAGGATPVRLILGDYLGVPSDKAGGGTGIQVEIFSREPLPVPGRVVQVVSAKTEAWWSKVTAATRHEALAEEDLPEDGRVYAYPLLEFLQWANNVTWQHEWKKYGVTDAGGAAVPAPPSPPTRTTF